MRYPGDLKLPACEKCRARKIRCDGLAPKCGPCQRRSVACIIVDSVTHERYTRQSVQELEDRLKILETHANHRRGAFSVDSPQKSKSPPDLVEANVGTPFVGDASGINFLKHIFSSSKWMNARADLTHYLSLQQVIPEAAIGSYSLPSYDHANMLVEDYFSNNHVIHPFLDPDTTRASLLTIYQHDVSQAPAQDLYRIYMILAIASVVKFRKGQITDNPYGYFMAAQQLASSVPMLGGVDGIQNLLLIARFAMYYYINCSIWDIARTCMRQCIELGLHQKPTGKNSVQTLLHSRIFWDCYIHDRYSSATLGRPFAIDDHDIDVELPDDISTQGPDHSGDIQISPFGFLIGLRRINSRIQTEIFSIRHDVDTQLPRSVTAAGRIYMQLQAFLAELQNWRDTAPYFSDPQSLFERAEWYDFVVEKDRLALIRGIMSRFVALSINIPKHIFHRCLECAEKVIRSYTTMFQRGQITWTRSYFHILFNAGLSMMFCLSNSTTSASRDAHVESVNSVGAEESLKLCQSVLRAFEAEMPDTRAFVLVFGALTQRFSHGHNPSRPRTRPESPKRPQVRDDPPLEAFQTDNGAQSQFAFGHGQQSNPKIISGSSQPLDSALPAIIEHPQGPDSILPEYLGNLHDVRFEGISNTFPLQDYNSHDASLFESNMLEHMEMGLGEYAWGNLLESNSVWNQWSANDGTFESDFPNTTYY